MKTKKTRKPEPAKKLGIDDYINMFTDSGLHLVLATIIAEHMKAYGIEPTANAVRAAGIMTVHVSYALVRSENMHLETSPEDALSVVSIGLHEAFMQDKRDLYDRHVAAAKQGAKVASMVKRPKKATRRRK